MHHAGLVPDGGGGQVHRFPEGKALRHRARTIPEPAEHAVLPYCRRSSRRPTVPTRSMLASVLKCRRSARLLSRRSPAGRSAASINSTKGGPWTPWQAVLQASTGMAASILSAEPQCSCCAQRPHQHATGCVVVRGVITQAADRSAGHAASCRTGHDHAADNAACNTGQGGG